MKDLKLWLKSQTKWIAVAIVIIIFLLVYKCNTNQQHRQDINSAVSQHEIENLTGANQQLEQQITGHKAVIDSLWSELDKQVIKLKQKDAQLIQKDKEYKNELARLSGLSDNDAVAEFLDKSDCGEIDIKTFDDSLYLIPICPIRQYNDIRAGFYMQVDVNTILRSKLQEDTKNSLILNGIIIEKDKTISDLNTTVSNDNKIFSEKDKQIQAEHKKYDAQRRKTWMAWGVGAVATTLAIIF